MPILRAEPVEPVRGFLSPRGSTPLGAKGKVHRAPAAPLTLMALLVLGCYRRLKPNETASTRNRRRHTLTVSRLPVKSLCQFKCVSPSWNSLISSPYFAQTHLNRTNNTNNNSSQKSILLSGSHAPYSVDFADANPTAKKLDFPASVNKWIHVSGSCNGLLLVSDKGDKSNFILNPSTRDCKKLPAFSLDSVSGSCLHLRGFGYDSAMDDYKVVMLSYRPDSNPDVDGDANIITNVAVYSLKTDAWRRIQDSHYVPLGFTSGINFNERLHWLCRRTGGLDYGSNVIVTFDLSDENFREVQLPASFGNYEIVYHQMAVLGGCLSLVVRSHRYRNEVWMMKEYGVRESWVKFTIDIGFVSQVWMILAKDEYLLKTHGNTIKGEYMDKLVVHNPVKEMLRNMVVRGIPTIFRYGGAYVESLVSPNHRGEIGRQ